MLWEIREWWDRSDYPEIEESNGNSGGGPGWHGRNPLHNNPDPQIWPSVVEHYDSFRAVFGDAADYDTLFQYRMMVAHNISGNLKKKIYKRLSPSLSILARVSRL